MSCLAKVIVLSLQTMLDNFFEKQFSCEYINVRNKTLYKGEKQMGYTTDFEGFFKFDRPLSIEHRNYLEKFAQTRRMKRNVKVASTLPDETRDAVNLPLGDDGAYFVGGAGYMGQDQDESVLDYNQTPSGQPSLWCQWTPNEDGTKIVWDGGEKFYQYIEWLKYLIANFIKPWGYTLNGAVQWQGEEDDDRGEITVQNNKVFVGKGRVSYEYDEDYHPEDLADDEENDEEGDEEK